MDIYHGSYRSPLECPLSVRSAEIDTSMTHGRAEIVVPVSTVDTVPSSIIIHRIGYIR